MPHLPFCISSCESIQPLSFREQSFVNGKGKFLFIVRVPPDVEQPWERRLPFSLTLYPSSACRETLLPIYPIHCVQSLLPPHCVRLVQKKKHQVSTFSSLRFDGCAHTASILFIVNEPYIEEKKKQLRWSTWIGSNLFVLWKLPENEPGITSGSVAILQNWLSTSLAIILNIRNQCSELKFWRLMIPNLYIPMYAESHRLLRIDQALSLLPSTWPPVVANPKLPSDSSLRISPVHFKDAPLRARRPSNTTFKTLKYISFTHQSSFVSRKTTSWPHLWRCQ